MNLLKKKTAASLPVHPVNGETLKTWLKKQDKNTQAWVTASGFTGDKGMLLSIPHKNGSVACILFGVSDSDNLYAYADLPGRLPKNSAGYYIEKKMTAEEATQAALGWVLGSYQFMPYLSGKKKEFAPLVPPPNADHKAVQSTAEAVFWVRDLVNTPANDLGPEELADAGKKLASTFKKARIKIITGNDLLKQNYPAIHAVGKGSPRQPRLIDIRWGDKKNPLVTLIGKGVCFDTGGLNIKTSGMAAMKKDMGGAAHALGLAQTIMAANLPLRLRVLIPAVENSIGGNSYRPSDIIQTRKGITVEVGDTDAEGRLVLCDAIAEACRDKPALMIDFATLTGAARVALGPDLPAMFCNNDKIAASLLEAATEVEDPLWRLPLWQPYKDMLKSRVADTNNIGSGGHAGAITAALFLEKFVDTGIPWVHIDTFAWNPGNKPGRPEGGEALGMRACYALIKKHFRIGK